MRTYRGHTGPVFAVDVANASLTLADGTVPIFSGGQDEALRMWSLPSSGPVDPYASVSTWLVGWRIAGGLGACSRRAPADLSEGCHAQRPPC